MAIIIIAVYICVCVCIYACVNVLFFLIFKLISDSTVKSCSSLYFEFNFDIFVYVTVYLEG